MILSFNIQKTRRYFLGSPKQKKTSNVSYNCLSTMRDFGLVGPTIFLPNSSVYKKVSKAIRKGEFQGLSEVEAEKAIKEKFPEEFI